ncbi:MAG: capsular polysaccharide biosynthesis protein CapF [Ruminococcaceae bacterium]|nr:capsular polysaccharide biosynthesis protein CapF [Oscillospiraceae bacterium]
MKVLVTGAKGFVGKNLITTIETTTDFEVFKYDIDTDPTLLKSYTEECDFVFHLAGVNRPENQEDFMKGNFGFTSLLLDSLKAAGNKAPILITSSIQAVLDNPYGKSKKAGEDLIFSYGKENGIDVFVYRMPNVFGKWCRPNYNSAVATFCHNIARDLPITVNDSSHMMNLVYIDDVVAEMIKACSGKANKNEDGFCYIEPVHKVTLGRIVELLESFKKSRQDLSVPDVSDAFVNALYATYLSYLPENEFSYELKMNKDDRGSFTEILRTATHGQFSVNVAKPGITKGNHWHHTKNEKFLVVSGTGVIRFRKPDSENIIEYFVSGDKMEVVDIPTGYTHNIENTGDTDLVTFMWCNECFNPDKPDTYFLKV